MWSVATVLGSIICGGFSSWQQVLLGRANLEVSAWSGLFLPWLLYPLLLFTCSLTSSNNWLLASLRHPKLVLPQGSPTCYSIHLKHCSSRYSHLTLGLCSRHLLGECWSKYHPHYSLCFYPALFFFPALVTALYSLVFPFSVSLSL